MFLGSLDVLVEYSDMFCNIEGLRPYGQILLLSIFEFKLKAATVYRLLLDCPFYIHWPILFVNP